MAKIKIKFKQEYKSFKKDSEYEFDGNLNILSGINGAGKSQLLDCIKNDMTDIYIDGIKVLNRNIAKYSFRDNISLPSFGSYDYNITRQYNSCIINVYKNYLSLHNEYNRAKHNNPNFLNMHYGLPNDATFELFLENAINASITVKQGNNNIGRQVSMHSILQIIEFVKKSYGEVPLELTDEQILGCIPSDFIIKLEDEEIDGITRIFTDAARLRVLEQANCGKKGIMFDNDEWLKFAPWTEINNLFEKLNFNYRFSEDYEYDIPNLKEEPKLFAFENNETNKRKIRQINDLSDGEKAILKLVILTYDRKEDNATKILLLDEYDATLNPSLIKDFYITIQEYYLDKGIIVLLSTHSPINIAMAPENSKYYEIFRQVDESPIIKEVSREEYRELEVLQTYYEKIKNPSERLKELEGENLKLKEKINSMTIPLVITEGKTDWKHIKNAKEKLNDNEQYDFFETTNDMGDSAILNILKAQSQISNVNKRIFIFDNDNKSIIKDVTEEGKKYKKWGNNVFSFVIPKPNIRLNEDGISIEHYYSDEVLKKEIVCEDAIVRRMYCGNDFLKNGNSKDLTKRCNKKNVCGDSVIRVLSGSSEEKVFDIDEEENNGVNYALSKDDFFENIIKPDNDIDLTSFHLILNIIKEIIEQN